MDTYIHTDREICIYIYIYIYIQASPCVGVDLMILFLQTTDEKKRSLSIGGWA